MIEVYDHIEDYLKGRLSKKDKLTFESALSHDVELKLLVDNFTEISGVSNGLLELELLEEVKSLGKTSNIPSLFKYLKIIVPTLILVGIAYLGFLNAQKSKMHKRQYAYFSTHYSRPENAQILRSSNVNTLEGIEKAKYYFELNEFQESEKVLRALLASGSSKNELNAVYFWLGHALVNQEKYSEALESFKKSNLPRAKKDIEFVSQILSQ